MRRKLIAYTIPAAYRVVHCVLREVETNKNLDLFDFMHLGTLYLLTELLQENWVFLPSNFKLTLLDFAVYNLLLFSRFPSTSSILK